MVILHQIVIRVFQNKFLKGFSFYILGLLLLRNSYIKIIFRNIVKLCMPFIGVLLIVWILLWFRRSMLIAIGLYSLGLILLDGSKSSKRNILNMPSKRLSIGFLIGLNTVFLILMLSKCIILLVGINFISKKWILL